MFIMLTYAYLASSLHDGIQQSWASHLQMLLFSAIVVGEINPKNGIEPTIMGYTRHIYIYENFIPGSFHVTLGSDAPLGLVERTRLSAISWQPEPGSGSSLTASARVKIQVNINEVGKFIENTAKWIREE